MFVRKEAMSRTCSQLFVLLHELAHCELGHRQPSMWSVPQEQQADDTALLHIVEHNPHIAKPVLESIVNYLRANNNSGNGTHPSDAERAKRIEEISNTASKELLGRLRIRNDNSISQQDAIAALNWIGYYDQDVFWKAEKMREADQTG